MEYINSYYDRDEVYNILIQIYDDESQDDITDRLDLIEYIKENDDRELSFLIKQDIVELEDIKETIMLNLLRRRI
jgi:hypothetical protein